MGYGNTVLGQEEFGGEQEPTGPVLHSASPAFGEVIDVSSTRLRVRLAAGVGVGVDVSRFEVHINGVVVYDSGGWAGGYSGYTQPHDDGSYTFVILRSTPWLPGTRYVVLFYIADNNGVGD